MKFWMISDNEEEKDLKLKEDWGSGGRLYKRDLNT